MANLKTLGPVSAKLITSLYGLNKTIFSVQDVVHITGLKHNSATDLTSELIKRNIITRIKPGKYLIIPPDLNETVQYLSNWYVIAREIAESPEYYISYYSAMDLHNMVTHPITKVFISAPIQKYKKNITIKNAGFEFVYIGKKHIWGIKNIWVTKTEQARVSDIERTIVDCLYKPKHCGGILEITTGIWMQKEKINFQRLIEYLIRFGKAVVIKRAGFILESMNLVNSQDLSALKKLVNERYYVLDPLLSTGSTHKNNWRLIANISPEEIKNAAGT